MQGSTSQRESVPRNQRRRRRRNHPEPLRHRVEGPSRTAADEATLESAAPVTGFATEGARGRVFP